MNRARLVLQAVILVLCLALFLTGCATPGTNTGSGAAGSGGADGAADGSATVLGLKSEDAGRQTRVVITGAQPLTYRADLESQPPAIVMDVTGQAASTVQGVTQVRNGLVDRVEVAPAAGQANTVRVRIELTRLTTYQVVRENNNLVVLVENAGTVTSADLDVPDVPLTAAQMAGGTARITGVDFKPVGRTGRTRLMIRTDKLVSPNVLSRDGGKTVILSVGPASIGPELSRALDTSYFQSAVNLIKPTQSAGKSVEFLIRLRSMVPYHLGQKGLTTYLDFDPTGAAPRSADLSKVRPGAPAVNPAAGAAGASSAAGAAGASPAAGAPGAAGAADGSPTTSVFSTEPGLPRNYTGQKISLDFQNADIHNIIRLIGEVSGKNVVVADKIQGKVTLKLSEIPWDQALDIVLASQKLSVVESGSVLRIDTAENIRKEKDLLIAESAQAAEKAKLTPLSKKVFTPRYAAVGVLEKDLTKLLSGRGKLTVIGNDIYVEDSEAVLENMTEVFDRNDRVAKQILIESRIVEATDEFRRDLGVNWGNHYNGSLETTGPFAGNTWNVYGAAGGGAAGAGGAAVNLITAPSAGLALGIGLISDRFSLDAKLYAYEKTSETRIVSAPRILASQDEEVYIKQGQAIAYETSGTTTAPATITYKEAVLLLKVKPHIEENGKIVTMEITITKDQAGTGRNPSISTREAKTKLMVKNGQTVVIGGILDDQQSKEVQRVPGLHKIPLLGWLFKSHNITDRKVELLIFLTANIIPVSI